MERLREKHTVYINNTDTEFIRSIMNDLPWKERLLGIKGFRGVGKTTLLLQYIRTNYGDSKEALYISLDDIFFSDNRLVDIVDSFVKRGGKHLFIDEVHRYPNWSMELKNIYDFHKELKVVFTGSSLLEILTSSADLSRRALVYQMQGLSYREFLAWKYKICLPILDLNEIISDDSLATKLAADFKPLQYFDEYLKFGYYPFFDENQVVDYQKLSNVINMIIEIELPLLRGVEISKVSKIKQLLFIVSQAVPFKPNIKKLSTKIGITRNTMVEYLKHLDDVNLLNTINRDSFGISLLQKPEKIYLENTNLIYALSMEKANIGNVRETFFLNQLQYIHSVTYPEKGDFLVNNKYLFEIGGKKKPITQIKNIENAYIVADNLEFRIGNKIPLWIFGLLY